MQYGDIKFNQHYTTGATVDFYNPHVPLSPYIAFKIGERCYDNRHRGDPNFIDSFSVNRPTNYLCTFDITIVNLQDLNLEKKLLQLIRNMGKEWISIQYGWAEGNKSPWYVGTVVDFKPQFLSNYGLTLTVSGYLSRTDSHFRTITYKGNSISDIVRQVCDYEGWRQWEIDETDKFSEEREFCCGNMKSIDFIREKLIPECVSADGYPYKFVLLSDAEGNKAYFVPENKGVTDKKKNWTYLINQGNYGSVISFIPSYTGVGLALAFGKEAALISEDKNELRVYEAEAKHGGKDKDNMENSIYGASSPDKMKALMQNMWYNKNIGAYYGELIVVGDPNIQPLHYINIFVFAPDGSLHHTSGKYFVTQITDNVGTSFTSTMKVVKIPDSKEGHLPFEQEKPVTDEDFDKDGSSKEKQGKAATSTASAW